MSTHTLSSTCENCKSERKSVANHGETDHIGSGGFTRHALPTVSEHNRSRCCEGYGDRVAGVVRPQVRPSV